MYNIYIWLLYIKIKEITLKKIPGDNALTVMFGMLKERDIDPAIFLKDFLPFAQLFPLPHYFEDISDYLMYDEIHNA